MVGIKWHCTKPPTIKKNNQRANNKHKMTINGWKWHKNELWQRSWWNEYLMQFFCCCKYLKPSTTRSYTRTRVYVHCTITIKHKKPNIILLFNEYFYWSMHTGYFWLKRQQKSNIYFLIEKIPIKQNYWFNSVCSKDFERKNLSGS